MHRLNGKRCNLASSHLYLLLPTFIDELGKCSDGLGVRQIQLPDHHILISSVFQDVCLRLLCPLQVPARHHDACSWKTNHNTVISSRLPHFTIINCTYGCWVRILPRTQVQKTSIGGENDDYCELFCFCSMSQNQRMNTINGHYNSQTVY